MPHLRLRHSKKLIEHLARVSPLVGLLGHRQVGKTTLLEDSSPNYLTFDDATTLDAALLSSKYFLLEHSKIGTVIDECQLCPPLFPALKERVRKNKRPGQYYLSGSVRFTSKSDIHESLAGRIMNTELLPLTLSELTQKPLPNWGIQILNRGFRSETIYKLPDVYFEKNTKAIELYLERGGLPGICFLKSEPLRAKASLDLITVILNRDLRQIYPTTLTLQSLQIYLRTLAKQEGQPHNFEFLKKASGLNPSTQKKLLFALESIFLIRPMKIEGTRGGFTCFFEDQFEAKTLSQNSLSKNDEWVGLVYRNLREQFFYQTEIIVEFFQYRTRSNVVIPFAVRSKAGILGIIPCIGNPGRTEFAAARSFLSRYDRSKVILVSNKNIAEVIDERIAVVSAAAILF